MSTLLRHACRQSRLVRHKHPQQQPDIIASLSVIDKAPSPSASSARLLTTYSPHRNHGRFSIIQTSIVEQLDLETKLKISADSRVGPTTVTKGSAIQLLFADRPNIGGTPLYLKPSPSTIGPGIGQSSTTIAPPLPLNHVKEIIEPTNSIQIVISDKRPGEKIIVGDQPSPNAVVEIIGDQMDNLVKKEAIRGLQIKRTQMNRHKLLKWRKKYKHLIKNKIERREKQAQKELDESIAGIHKNADVFNPVDKVRRHVELAKEMGYGVTYYKELKLVKWLDSKDESDKRDQSIFNERKNEMRYRKMDPWEKEKW